MDDDIYKSRWLDMRMKYAFIKIRSKHTIIDQIKRILEYTFPDYELEIIDVKKILKKNIHIVLVNLFHMIYIYGIKTLIESKSVIYNRFFGTPYMYHSINRLLNSSNTHNYIFTLQDCSLFNGKMYGIPHFVYTDHTVLANKNYPEFDQDKDLLSADWLSLEGNIYRDAETVFTRSMIIRESVIEDYKCDPNKVHCIYYAPFSDNRPLNTDASKYSTKKILFVGFEWERKGGPILVSAFARVLEQVHDAHLIIVGCKPTVKHPNVEVVGPVSKDILHRYYENSAVFCLPTRQEPFGIVFIEAMSYGLPVVGTAIGAIPELITDQENGYLVDIDDDERLANILIALLSDPNQCEVMGRRGYAIYREKFTLDVVSSSLKKFITPYILNRDDIRSN